MKQIIFISLALLFTLSCKTTQINSFKVSEIHNEVSFENCKLTTLKRNDTTITLLLPDPHEGEYYRVTFDSNLISVGSIQIYTEVRDVNMDLYLYQDIIEVFQFEIYNKYDDVVLERTDEYDSILDAAKASNEPYRRLNPNDEEGITSRLIVKKYLR